MSASQRTGQRLREGNVMNHQQGLVTNSVTHIVSVKKVMLFHKRSPGICGVLCTKACHCCAFRGGKIPDIHQGEMCSSVKKS